MAFFHLHAGFYTIDIYFYMLSRYFWHRLEMIPNGSVFRILHLGRVERYTPFVYLRINGSSPPLYFEVFDRFIAFFSKDALANFQAY